jgi:sporulation protein YlmC with PRC-barrel domain
MPQFGEYETVEQVSIIEDPRFVTTVWKAWKTGVRDRLCAVKCYAPRRGRTPAPQPDDKLQQDHGLTYIEGIKQLKKAQSEGGPLTPVHAFGLAPEGAWYVTDYCDRGTLREYIDRKGDVDHPTLRYVVYRIVTGCLALRRARGGKSHGNLKLTNVLLSGPPNPLRKTPLLLTDPYPAPHQLAALQADDQQIGNEAVELQDLRSLGELILQLVESRLLRSSYEYNYPVARSAKWDGMGKSGEFWRGLCNRLLDPKLSLEQENLEKLELALRAPDMAKKAPMILAVAGAVVLIGIGAYWGISALSKHHGGGKPPPKGGQSQANTQTQAPPVVIQDKVEGPYRAATNAAWAALQRKDFPGTTNQAGVALRLKPGDAVANDLMTQGQKGIQNAEAMAKLERDFQAATNAAAAALKIGNYPEVTNQAGIALKHKPGDAVANNLMKLGNTGIATVAAMAELERKYQAATNAAQAALKRKDYPEATNQAGLALKLKPEDTVANDLMRQGQEGIATTGPMAELERNYQGAMTAGQAALGRKDYAEAIKQAGLALAAKVGDGPATKLRTDARTQLDMANNAKAQEEKYQAAMTAGQAAFGLKDYAEAIRQAEVALTVKAGDGPATKLRTDARTQLDMANNAKAQEEKYQAAMTAGQAAFGLKDYAEAIRQAEVALAIKAGDGPATKLRTDARTQLDMANNAKAQEEKYQAAMTAGQAAFGLKDYAEAIRQAEVALAIKAGDGPATKLRTDAQTQLDMANNAKAQEEKYQAAMTAGQAALGRKEYAEAIKQAEVALAIKAGDGPATKLRTDARTQLDMADNAKVQEQKYLAAVTAGQAALGRKDYAEAIKQADLALTIKAGDGPATKLRTDAQTLSDMANNAKAQEEKYQAAMTAGQAALGLKDYAEAIRQAEVALAAKAGDGPATKLRTDARTQLDMADNAKAQEQKYQAAMIAGQAALGRKDYAEAIKQAGIALKLKPEDTAANNLMAQGRDGMKTAPVVPVDEPDRFKAIQQVSRLIGTKVFPRGKSPIFDTIGKLEDVALDVSAGKLVLGLVSKGSKSLVTPVPAGSFISASPAGAELAVDEKTFSDASGLNVPKASWAKGMNRSVLEKIFSYFKQDLAAASVGSGEVSSRATWLGTKVVDQAGEQLGVVDDFVVDLPKGLIVFLVIKPSVGPDPQSCWYIVPSIAVQPDSGTHALVLKATKDVFVKGGQSRVEKAFPVGMTDADRAAAVFQYYRQALSAPMPSSTTP